MVGALLRFICIAMASFWLCQTPQSANAQDAVQDVVGDVIQGTVEDTNEEDTVAAETFTPKDYDRIHKAYLETDDLQLERPTDLTYRPDIEPDFDFDPSPAPKWLQNIASFLGVIFRLLFYVGIGIVILGVLYFIITQATDLQFGRPKDKKGNPDDIYVDVRPDKALARSLLEEADALARQGRFSEAVHLLLFRSIEDIQSKLGNSLAPSMTSREIGMMERLPAQAKAALSPIIKIVERSFFGAQDVDEIGWKDARASYEDFAFGDAWT